MNPPLPIARGPKIVSWSFLEDEAEVSSPWSTTKDPSLPQETLSYQDALKGSMKHPNIQLVWGIGRAESIGRDVPRLCKGGSGLSSSGITIAFWLLRDKISLGTLVGLELSL